MIGVAVVFTCLAYAAMAHIKALFLHIYDSIMFFVKRALYLHGMIDIHKLRHTIAAKTMPPLPPYT